MRHELTRLCQQVQDAQAEGRRLSILGGNTKPFYGETLPDASSGEPLSLAAYQGIINHEPSELVLTARAGTLMADIESALDDHGQMLGFEPPRFGDNATLGGCIAAGLAGPRRMAAGHVSDFVLGARLLTSSGDVLAFGGEVMKNVAGYDVSRLLAGSLGSLGAMVELSIKVIPRPANELTLAMPASHEQAIGLCNGWRALPLPVTATAHLDDTLHVRLSGSRAALDAAREQITSQGECQLLADADADIFWTSLRDQTHEFFKQRPLWRLSVPPTTIDLQLGRSLTEWHGGLRWLSTDMPASELRALVARHGGNATLYRASDSTPDTPFFHPLDEVTERINRQMMDQLDPQGMFHPGRRLPVQQG